VLDQLPVSLHEPLLQARQRPGIDSLRQHEPTPQVAQVNFYDAASDYPNESFEKVTRRMLGTKGFPQTKDKDSFRKECRAAFEMGRCKAGS